MPTATEIRKLRRAELDELAEEHGLDPKAYSRAEDLKTVLIDRLADKRGSKPKSEEKKQEKDQPQKDKKDKKGQSKHPTQQHAPEKHTRTARRGKRYVDAYEQVDREDLYQLDDALDLLEKVDYANFDSSVELHINLGVDPNQADQVVRGTITLPHGTGKTQKVAVLAQKEDSQKAAKDAGADQVGFEDILESIENETFDFDVLVAADNVMGDLAKHGKTLGPKGLMPSPKSGTVTSNVAETVEELKAGRIEFRIDPQGIIHQVVGKMSFDQNELRENILALVKAVQQARPAEVSQEYFQKVTLTATMSPGIKLDIPQLISAM